MKENNREKKQPDVSGKKRFRGSIKLKLLAIIIPITILTVVSLIIVSYSRSKSIIKNTAGNLLQASTKNQVNEIESWLNENLSAFKAVKTAIESTRPSGETLQKILNSYSGYNGNYPDGLYIADETGSLMTASASISHKNEDVLNSIWYQEGLTHINMAFGSAYKNPEGKNVISASGMLLDQSGTVKVLSVDLSLDRISIIVNSLIEMKDAEAFLVDLKDGTILAHRDNSLISKKLDTTDPLLKAVADKIAAKDFNEIEVKGNIVDFGKIAGTNWLLVSYVPSSSIFTDLTALKNFMILIGIVSIIVLCLVTERVMQIVLKPVKELTSVIVTMSQGNFAADVKVKGNDEISLMSQSVKDFIAVMRVMITDISTISAQLYHQAEGGSQISNQLFQSSKQQSDSMKDLNTTVDELAHSVNEIADSATKLANVVTETSKEGHAADEKMKETVHVSEEGRKNMEKARDAMVIIQNSVSEVAEAINKVGSASVEITNIVNLIGNIAEETNLLSLNASIEAARAGSAGKSFAVVASEIGKLAHTSATAVSDITNLIHEIRELVSDAVHRANESTGHINDNSRVISSAVGTFDGIYDAIQNSNQLVQNILIRINEVDEVATTVAAISEEQAASAEEILATSELMVIQSDSISENSKDVAADAEQLTATANSLGDQVQMFKL